MKIFLQILVGVISFISVMMIVMSDENKENPGEVKTLGWILFGIAVIVEIIIINQFGW